ncbi:MAG: alanine racemase [Acidobacteriota bacterium]
MIATPTPAADPKPADVSPDTRHLNSWLEIDGDAYRHNLRFLRDAVGPAVELSAVVKSNAYGHGLEAIARLAIDGGADSFCVHSIDEALALRALGFGEDILVMGHIPLARLREAVAHNLRIVLFNRETVEELGTLAEAVGVRPRVHLKIETGTHRQGLAGAELDSLIEALERHPAIDIEGAYTHFADIEDTTDHAYAQGQLSRFRGELERLADRGIRPRCRHSACSAAAVLFPETHFEMARVGISQYGFWSSKETKLSFEHRRGHGLGPRPVLAWKTRVSQVKSIAGGASVGYGRTWRATRDSRIAILPIGYSDGYDRGFSNAAHVLIRGRRAPVRGRICMNLTMVDVTDIPGVGLEDAVVLLGADGEERITADDLAALAGTIHYEVVTRISPHLPRLVVKG